MVLSTALQLDLLELIKKLGGPPRDFVSAADVAVHLPATNPAVHTTVDRILRLLASHSVLNCTLRCLPNGRVERAYSLAPVCELLTKNGDGVSMAPLCLLNQDKHSIGSCRGNLFYRAMSEHSTIILKKILDKYDGFGDGTIKSLVDVGGATGAALAMITSKYPSIKGINFDLDQIIRNAPSYPGVEHVAGDMFVSVPKGDAIFMKWVCHDWDDDECLEILRNCYESLPKTGKVILSEYILPELPDNGEHSKYVGQLDLILMAYSPSDGKERTEKEYRGLAVGAGFKDLVKVCCAHGCWILELRK